MASVTITIPDQHVARVKTALIGYYNLDPAISNADLLTFVKTTLATYIRDIVRNQEVAVAQQQASAGVNTDGLAS